MQNYPGVFIVLEGSDGSGKSTQFGLLAERLKAVGYDVETFKFPRYEADSSVFIRKYLDGGYGPANAVNPYTASLFYAMDRFEASEDIRSALAAGKVVISDRYVGANMAHQGSKFSKEAEQRGFFIWADSLEYDLLSIPRPNLSLFLRVPASISERLITQRAGRRDQHDADSEHLRRAVKAYDTLCKLFPKDFQAIDCAPNGQLLGITDISDLIWHKLQPYLPQNKPRAAKASQVKLSDLNKTVARRADKPEQLKKNAGHQSPKEPQKTQNREINLLDLIQAAQEPNAETRRTLKELSLKDGEFYVPNRLEDSLRKDYISKLRQMTALKNKLHTKLKKHNPGQASAIARQLLPMATLTRSDLPAAKLNPDPDSALTKLARERLSINISVELEPYSLTEFWPRNEFELLSDGLYGLSDLPRSAVQAEVETWDYNDKHAALIKLLDEPGQPGLNSARYEWDVICSQGTLLELLTISGVGAVRSQPVSPRYGYNVPTLVETAGAEDEFLDCFDLSLELYSQLQGGGFDELAAYATLLGHKLRFQFTIGLEGLKQLFSAQPKSDELLDLRAGMSEKLQEAHPIIGDYIYGARPQKTHSRGSHIRTKGSVSKAARRPKK